MKTWRDLQPFDNAPYRVVPSSTMGAYNVMGKLSHLYPICVFQGLQAEAEAVADLFNRRAGGA